MRINQNGFRHNRSIVAQILILRRLLEGIKAKNLPAIMAFIDFKKAFDSIHRSKLMEILAAYGVPDIVVAAINGLYTSTGAKVLSPDKETESFEMLAGVLQGDTLAPYLFVKALDYAMKIAIVNEEDLGLTLAKAKSRQYPATYISDTNFADVIALLSNTRDQAPELLQEVETPMSQIGLHINFSKTEYMSLNQVEGDIVTKGGEKLKRVEIFLYLGAWIGSSEKDIEVKIAKVWAA